MKNTLLPLAILGAGFVFAVPAQADTFDGPYVGVTASWDRGEVDSSINSQAIDAEASRDALFLGGYAGYNYKLSEKVVIGAEAGFTATVDDRIRTASAGNDLTIDPRYSFDLKARAGYLVTDKALVYVRGGYANQRGRTSLETGTSVLQDSENLDGWLVGGGVRIRHHRQDLCPRRIPLQRLRQQRWRLRASPDAFRDQLQLLTKRHVACLVCPTRHDEAGL